MKLQIGVSECLLGRKVRHDGGHKHDRFLTDTLSAWVDWVPVCPEVEIGLGTPRPAMRLVAEGTGARLVVRNTGEDLTARMQRWAQQRLPGFAGLHGFVLKKDSPSCGMERVKRYTEDGNLVAKDGSGIFAAALREAYSLLPVEEEGRLNDPVLRENFIERVFAYRRWREFVATDPGPGDLVAFHTANKMTLLSHHPQKYRELGRWVAEAGRRRDAIEEYGTAYMDVLRHRATRSRHRNVLQHLIGHLKKMLDGDDRQELVEVIESYGSGEVPLVVPLTLLRHHFRRHGTEWVMAQTYLDPYPSELMLRNHV
jgi:uncharacterized protein YbgA (DUF1722 family)/uncharacterized protein YbbK (DUF523 family)